jgi:GGDEF domain-containing protein
MSSRAIKGLTGLFFLLLTGTVAVGLLYTRTHKIDQANNAFQVLVPAAEQLVQTYQTMDQGLRYQISSTIFGLLSKDDAAAFTVISDSRGETILLWQKSGGSTVPRPTGAAPAYSMPSTGLQTVVFETSLPGALHLVAAFTVLSPDDLLLYSYLALAGLALWLVFLLLTLWMSPTPSTAAGGVPDLATAVTVAEPEDGRAAPGKEESLAAVANPGTAPSGPARPEASAASAAPQARAEERDSKFVLLDRKTGVTQERFLKFRLDKELERNAENAMDLSLAIFRFAGLAADDYSAAAALLLGEFSHEDLIFEFGDDMYCVILPQHDLDQAIVRSELVVKKTENAKSNTFKQPFELTVGLTSRNGRLLDAGRFIREGQTALKKASREEGRIVGFRPDPVRFRSFLRHQRV